MDHSTTPMRLDQFPITITEKLRFGDTDRLGHINNAVFATMCESGRVAFLYDTERPLLSEGAQFVIAKLTINFLSEMNWPADVVIGTAVARIGNSSFNLLQGLFIDNACVASSESVLVLMDEVTRRSTPLSDHARAVLQELSVK